MIRTFMIFTGTGPILVVSRLAAGADGAEARAILQSKGIDRYLAFEVSSEVAERRYGTRFHSAVQRLASDHDLRVVDLDGHHVFASFSFAEMGTPQYVGGAEG